MNTEIILNISSNKSGMKLETVIEGNPGNLQHQGIQQCASVQTTDRSR